MKILQKRLQQWKKLKETYDFNEFALELKNGYLIDELENNHHEKINIEQQIDFCVEDLRVMVGDLAEEFDISLDTLSDNMFINIETRNLACLYEYDSKCYEKMFFKIVDFFVEIFEKIEILINHYGEKNIYFNDLEDLYSDFSFYESYVLQIENLIEEISNDKFLSDNIKGQLLCKLIPIEIINMDYLFSINKYFYRGKFTTFSIDVKLKECYIDRFHELCEIYQKLINLKIINFPSGKDVVDVKIKQMNIKNKYNITTDKNIIPEL